VDDFAPGGTLFARYRLERLLVAHASVAVWEATDLHYDKLVQVSLFEDGSTMLDHGRIDRGNFVVIDPPSPRVELAYDPPLAPRSFLPRPRVWPWAFAGAACAALAIGAMLPLFRARPPATSVTTITAASIAPPAMSIPPPPPEVVPSAVPSADPTPKKKPKAPRWDESTIRF
jgi:hypothetical protein